jgi:hypothetical protein
MTQTKILMKAIDEGETQFFRVIRYLGDGRINFARTKPKWVTMADVNGKHWEGLLNL